MHHRGEMKRQRLLLGDAEADEPAPVTGHEIDVLGRAVGGRDDEIAFVLPVLVVHDDHHATFTDLVEELGCVVQGHGQSGRCWAGDYIVTCTIRGGCPRSRVMTSPRRRRQGRVTGA